MATSVPAKKTTAGTSHSVYHEATVDLSIRLMNPGVKPVDALKMGHGLLEHKCDYGTLLYETPKAEPPDRANFLEAGAPGLKAKLTGQHSTAVLLIEARPTGAKRLFAISFGQGHHAVEDRPHGTAIWPERRPEQRRPRQAARTR